VIFLNADDTLLTDTAGRVEDVFARQPEIAKIHYPLEVVDQDRRPTGLSIRAPHLQLPDGDLRERVLRSLADIMFTPTSGNAFSASCLKPPAARSVFCSTRPRVRRAQGRGGYGRTGAAPTETAGEYGRARTRARLVAEARQRPGRARQLAGPQASRATSSCESPACEGGRVVSLRPRNERVRGSDGSARPTLQHRRLSGGEGQNHSRTSRSTPSAKLHL
jgi:hypothetical protein